MLPHPWAQPRVDADEDDYTRWSVAIPAETLHDDTLRRELRTFASNTRQPAVVALRVVFPPDYPDAVPYVRVVRPRFVYQTGHVTIGGSFCSEVLTAQGWRPMTVDALLRSLVLTLHEGRARIQLRPDAHCGKPLVDYDEREASAAYQRALMTHGWA